MIYDIRTYDIAPGRVQDYMKNVREIAIPIRQDHGVKLGGWYYSDVGPLNQVVHIWAFEDLNHLREGGAAVRSDPRWVNDYMPSNRGLVQAQRDQLTYAADFAPSSYDPGEAPTPMIYDMRIYDINPGMVPEYMSAVRDVGLPVRQSHDVRLAGWFYDEIGSVNQVMHIWAYQGFADLEKKMKAVSTDLRWVEEYRPRVMNVIARQRDQLMFGADFFPGPQ